MKLTSSILLAIATMFPSLASVSHCGISDSLSASVPDTIPACVAAETVENPYRFGWKQLIAPASLITVGTVGMERKWFRNLNDVVPPEESQGSKAPTPIDDIIQYSPIVGVYSLKLCRVPSRSDYLSTTLILAMSTALSVSAVQGAKHLFTVWRPDGSMPNSFPSGHTATAFMGAELMRQEFKDTAPWVCYAGYAVAVATGTLRVCHDRHWLTDVLAGAGIGILSVRVAYWLYPYVTKLILPGLYRRNVSLSAYGAPTGMGLTLQYTFNGI